MREKIAVLMGGRSLEREVSLASGSRVCEALEALGYYVLPLDVTADLVSTLRSERPSAAYIALHGKYGEDGTIQELLEFLGIQYTGPGVVASALTWDKSVAKHLFAENDIDTPPWLTLTADAFKEMGAATAIDLMGEVVGGFPVANRASLRRRCSTRWATTRPRSSSAGSRARSSRCRCWEVATPLRCCHRSR